MATGREPVPSVSPAGTWFCCVVCVPAGRMVLRTTALAGDRLFVSGSIGDSSLGLALLRKPALRVQWKLSQDEADGLIQRYRRPQPRLALAPALRQFASAAMDLSDGLVKDCDRLLRASGVAGRIDLARIPISPLARRLATHLPDAMMTLITAGDDYEILAAIPPGKTAGFIAAAASADVAVAEIGMIEAGTSTLVIEDGSGRPIAIPDRPGWDHF